MKAVEVIASLIGGGLIQYGLQLYLNSGKSKLNTQKLSITYSFSEGSTPTISFLTLDLQFINTSAYKVIVEDIKAILIVGEIKIKLNFAEYRLPPACVIADKGIKELHLELLPEEKNIALPLIEIKNDTCYLELSYSIKGRSTKSKIMGQAIELIRDEKWVAF